MKRYYFYIKGVHYAANPKLTTRQTDTDEALENTRKLLECIDHMRPLVVLSPHPDNPSNPDAVIARAEGQHIGYVSDNEVPQAQDLLACSCRHKLAARVVEVKKDITKDDHGYIKVEVMADEPLHKVLTKAQTIEWEPWTNDELPTMPIDDDAMDRDDAEFLLETMLMDADSAPVDKLTTYVALWIKGARNDLSREARQTRNTMIEQLIAATKPELHQLAAMLERQRTSICGLSMASERYNKWWPAQLEAPQMQALFKRYAMMHQNRWWTILRQIDHSLRQLPGNLYYKLGSMQDVLSCLYYMNTPRKALRSILALLMLRQLTCRKLGIDMKPMCDDEYERDGLETNLRDIPTTLGRVIDYASENKLTAEQRDALHQCLYCLRDEYWGVEAIDIEQPENNDKERVVVHGDLVLEKETNIDNNYAPNIEQTGGTLALPENLMRNGIQYKE